MSDLKRLSELSEAATSGEWTAEEGGRITAAGTSPGYDISVWGTILTARDTRDIEDGVTHWATDGERQANARYVAALVNAHRSGKLVLASGSGEETPEPSPQSSPTLKTGGMTVEAAAWPSGCIKPNSCARNRRCQYALTPSCLHSGKDLTAEIETALRTLQGEAAE